MPDNDISHILLAVIALLLLLLPVPVPTFAQANDSAYCAELGELVLRYAGSPGGDGSIGPDFATLEAIDNCNKGKTAAGIKALEQKLRNNGFTLPKRMAPA